MGQRLFYALLALVTLTGLGVVIYFGIQPRTVPKINFSQFASPEEMGRATAQRLRLELQNAPLLLIGVWPEREEEVRAVQGLLEALNGPGLHYDVVVTEPKLPFMERFTTAEKISLRDELSRFVEGAKPALQAGKRVVAIVPSSYSTQILKENPAARLKAEFAMEPLSLSLAPMSLRRDDEGSSGIFCTESLNDAGGAGPLGCAVLQKSRTMYRKKKDPSKFSGSLDQIGGRDYLLLLAPPAAVAP